MTLLAREGTSMKQLIGIASVTDEWSATYSLEHPVLCGLFVAAGSLVAMALAMLAVL